MLGNDNCSGKWIKQRKQISIYFGMATVLNKVVRVLGFQWECHLRAKHNRGEIYFYPLGFYMSGHVIILLVSAVETSNQGPGTWLIWTKFKPV